MSESISQIRAELQGDTAQTVCNREAGSFSRLWGRDCWVADTVLKLIQCSIDEQMDASDPNDPLFDEWPSHSAATIPPTLKLNTQTEGEGHP